MMVGTANPHTERAKKAFLKSLKAYRDQLTKQEIRTLRGQAKTDLLAARKGLKTLLEKRNDK